MNRIRFIDEAGTFAIRNPEEISYLYFPLAGETGLMSAITPTLGGDSKLDQETFLLEPVSAENLHNNRGTRNFWCVTEDGCWSAAGVSAEQEAARFTPDMDESELTAGFLWQTLRRESRKLSLRSELTSFIPPDQNVEILHVRITNTGDAARTLRGVAAIPIYGRSADNIRDHRNVTSMLHRIRTTEHGVLVKPTMSFDEKGHRVNNRIYYVLGSTGTGQCPESFYSTLDAFLGEGGTFLHPRSVYERLPGDGANAAAAGRASITFSFAGKQFSLTVINVKGLEYGAYGIGKACIQDADAGRPLPLTILDGKVILSRKEIMALPMSGNEIVLELI